VVLTATEFDDLAAGRMRNRSTLRLLRAKHLIRGHGETLPIELLAMKLRTRYRRLADFTALHIFVVTLRCEHACRYCQVSRQNSDKHQFDMTDETAQRALATTFMSPAQSIKIEFQGGEPLLNFGLVESVVQQALAINESHDKDLSFVIASNLALLDDNVIRFCLTHGVSLSASLDGPEDLHNRNRPRPGGDSWERAIAGIRRAQDELGPYNISALMTTTEASLPRVREIIDCYVDHGLNGIFLRPISPYGFAIRTKSHSGYDTSRWLAFYEEGLDYILDLNRRGVDMIEFYAATVLKKMLTNDDPGYVDLMSPAGIGIRALVYNYDGDVYASDEGRMLAEMGDTTFKLGNLHHDSYAQMMTSDALLDPLESSFTLSAPMCSDCAFEPFCGADPVFHHATTGDFLARKPESAFCQRNMAIFEMIIDRYNADRETREIFRSWAAR
jgi:His-Xaa-Ser system radical SAM maturase HxsB